MEIGRTAIRELEEIQNYKKLRDIYLEWKEFNTAYIELVKEFQLAMEGKLDLEIIDRFQKNIENF